MKNVQHFRHDSKYTRLVLWSVTQQTTGLLFSGFGIVLPKLSPQLWPSLRFNDGSCLSILSNNLLLVSDDDSPLAVQLRVLREIIHICQTIAVRKHGLAIAKQGLQFIYLLLQEILFNAVACFSYLSSCSYLGFSVNTLLYPLYVVTPYFQVYPAMSAAYVSINI